jgi:streptogramin lyase
MKRLIPLSLFWAVLAVAGCGSSKTKCKEGTEKCPCYPNLTCNAGLSCFSDTCVNAMIDASAGPDGNGQAGGPDGVGGPAGTMDTAAAGVDSLADAADIAATDAPASPDLAVPDGEAVPNADAPMDYGSPDSDGTWVVDGGRTLDSYGESGTADTGKAGGCAVTEFLVPTVHSDLNCGIVAGPDGNIWFTESIGNNIGRITPTGTITEFPLPNTNCQPYCITNGPDGNLWFACNGVRSQGTTGFTGPGSLIGRITPSGTITEFPLPNAGGVPWGITGGPDGNLWFTESGNGGPNQGTNIGRITPTGTITEFPLPNVNCGPRAITSGPDGNLWFTEVNTNKIGRITTTGTITEFSGTSTPVAFLQGIAAAPDGNLWFTDLTDSYVGRITPTGTTTRYPTTSAANAIVAGPDGDLWFTERSNKIGRMTPTGGITECPVTGNPYGITAGPDGNIWFTEQDGNKIGRIAL